MDALHHMIYEIDRGVRALAVFTTSLDQQAEVEARIQKTGLHYILDSSGKKNLNVFFGKPECIETLRRFSTLRLDKITLEEDFILGTMLGYDLCKQCRRYNERRHAQVADSEGELRSAPKFFHTCLTAGMCGISCSFKAATPVNIGRHCPE